ncbi:Protein disulfide-isomerase-like Protein [Tribolium castaneum]|uniref:Protein disulfide-isomerase n=1 Tax=Tribolium castaneum TaxID=7070 RepID=D6W727_TRICA|nr:PREDICTED: protein disulfide-isomerase A3 [Tribolium castaneum]EFA11421.1 Protein disulfide-isomerase-like Protein [Tribolium castaneum]|eukprot:XP_971685.1 PREDICTED: protein disulfide-isomerase A3 [Tribolium castaneum]
MFLQKIFVLCLFYCACFAKEEDVLEFSDSDFESRVAEHETALVMFYAPWCGHCKKLKPEYAKAAEDLIRNDPPIALVKVDCTEAGKETCNKHGVSGYPTLKIFRNGEFSQEYGGPREAGGIVKYMKAQVGPSSKELTSVQDLEKFLKAENDVSVVGFFEKESDLKTAFLKLADKLREKVRFAHSTYKPVLEKQGVSDGIVLFRPQHLHNKFEDDSVVYSGGAVTGEIQDFINKNYHGLVGHRKSDNRNDFQNPLVVSYYGVDYVKNPKGTNYWRNRVLKVAKQHKDKINFAVSAKDDFQYELNEYGIDYVKEDKPVVLARDAKNQKFIMKDPFSIEALDSFVQDLLAGKLEPYLKSEPIPENNDGPVTVAVAKNFDEVVLNNGKDTLIEFYAPWCTHCKKLAPVFDELGEKMKNEDVAIVKMDATANDVPQPFDVRGFPTLYWAAKDSKDSPVRYEGGREVDDFVKYIAKHATSELKGYDRKGNPKAEKTEL